MTAFPCPKCTLAFASKNELENHCRNDNESFHHEFRAAPPGPNDHLPASDDARVWPSRTR